MIKQSRTVVALALALAIAVSGLALADGAGDNQAFVDGKVKPTKRLDKKKFKTAKSLFLGVRNVQTVTGNQSNPASELINIDSNIETDLKGVPQCSATPPNGSTPEQAKASCPKEAFLGSGVAEVQFPPPAGTVSDVIVSVFHGPTGAQPANGRRAAASPLILHTYSPTLQTASPSVQSFIVKSKAGREFGQALSVPNTPETGAGLITEFNATIGKDPKIVSVRCKDNDMIFERKVVYKDGSSETVETSQKCKAKKN